MVAKCLRVVLYVGTHKSDFCFSLLFSDRAEIIQRIFFYPARSQNLQSRLKKVWRDSVPGGNFACSSEPFSPLFTRITSSSPIIRGRLRGARLKIHPGSAQLSDQVLVARIMWLQKERYRTNSSPVWTQRAVIFSPAERTEWKKPCNHNQISSRTNMNLSVRTDCVFNVKRFPEKFSARF